MEPHADNISVSPCSLKFSKGCIVSGVVGESFFSGDQVSKKLMEAVVNTVDGGGVLCGSDMKQFLGRVLIGVGGEAPPIFTSLLNEYSHPSIFDYDNLFKDPVVKIPAFNNFPEFLLDEKPEAMCPVFREARQVFVNTALGLSVPSIDGKSARATRGPVIGGSGYIPEGRPCLIDSIHRSLDGLWDNWLSADPNLSPTSRIPTRITVFSTITTPISGLLDNGFGSSWHRVDEKNRKDFPFRRGRQYAPGVALRGFAYLSAASPDKPVLMLFEREDEALRAVKSILLDLRHRGRVFTDSAVGLRCLLTWLSALYGETLPQELIHSRNWICDLSPLPKWSNFEFPDLSQYASLFGAEEKREISSHPPCDFGQKNLITEYHDWATLVLAYLFSNRFFYEKN